jgi:hypothetical protein
MGQPPNKLNVLPTTYRNIKFRSRLEARWAAYFDMIGVKWQYEPEGYHLDYGNYCPDFLCEDGDFFVEVKPTKESLKLTENKLRSLAKMTGKFVYCVVGPPSLSAQWGCNENGDNIEWSIFCYYAFTTKGWGCPFFGEFDGLDEPYHHQAANMRFENGVA